VTYLVVKMLRGPSADELLNVTVLNLRVSLNMGSVLTISFTVSF